ncbi:MAG: hypothetical protein J7M11_03930 [Elusimicrobia bacterium]|nr:hypothetical protein [Elusimicrobiota bacterium]
MKKFVSLMVAAMFALPSFASVASAGSVLDGLKLSGEITVNKVSVDNEVTASDVGDDYRSETQVRTILNMDMPLADDMDARVVLTKNDQKFGDSNGNDQALLSGWPNTGAADNVNVTNAYIKVKKLFDLIDLKVGRMFYGERDDLALYIGPTYDYDLDVAAIDGYLANAEIKGVNVEYLDAKLMEVGVANKDKDTNLQGLCLSPVSKIADMVSGKFYVYKIVDNDVTAAYHDTNTTLLYGLKASAEVSGVNVKAEYAMNGGTDETIPATDVDYKGKAAILGASAKVSGINVRAEYANGSGDKTSTADKNEAFTAEGSDVRYGEIWGNTTETTILGGAGVANLNVMNIGADYDVNDKVKASADFLMLKTNEKVATAPTPAGTKKIGNEIDLKVSYDHSENLSMDLVVARLMCDSAFGTDDIDKVNLQMNFRF